MARVTIEDCLLYIPNRFKIVELAASRAREIANGARTTVDGESAADHKVTVLALREIASGQIDSTPTKNEFDEFSLFDDSDDAGDIVDDITADEANSEPASPSEDV